MRAFLAFGAGMLALAAVVAAPVQAADAPASERTCFSTRDIEAHSFGGPNTIYLRLRSDDVVALESKSNCTTAHLRGDPLILNPAPQSGRVCSPLDLSLKIGTTSGGPGTPCIIDSIRKLTPAEIAALPKGTAP